MAPRSVRVWARRKKSPLFMLSSGKCSPFHAGNTQREVASTTRFILSPQAAFIQISAVSSVSPKA